jgi:hypothetical protein
MESPKLAAHDRADLFRSGRAGLAIQVEVATRSSERRASRFAFQ